MKLPFSPSIFYASLFLVLFGMGVVYHKFDADQKELVSIVQTLIVTQQTELQRTQKEIEALRVMSEAESEEKESEIAAQNSALAALSSRLSVLQDTASEEAGTDTAVVVDEWKGSVFKVSCSFIDVSRRRRVTQAGSGVGMNLSDGAIFMTNRHVLTRDDDSILEDCTVTSTGGNEFVLPLADARVDPNLDFSFVIFDTPQTYFNKTLTNANICEVNTVKQGESIVIMGYPLAGVKNSVTVTEGIISGFETDYYVTSAKIEQGNSGGAAILSSQSCLLGLPTFAQVGKVESFARILKLEKLLDI